MGQLGPILFSVRPEAPSSQTQEDGALGCLLTCGAEQLNRFGSRPALRIRMVASFLSFCFRLIERKSALISLEKAQTPFTVVMDRSLT